MTISFNQPVKTKGVLRAVEAAFWGNFLRGDGVYGKKCCQWMEQRCSAKKALLTPSCTHALEMTALLLNIRPGDEVIMPSFTFCSTANAFVLRGAAAVFVDIRPDTMNMDEKRIEAAVTDRTRGIVAVHYGGVACEMDTMMDIARRHHLFVVEDAAQGVMSSYRGQALGTIGDLGCYSFHETKNYSMGEGGALLVNREEMIERAEIIREKGTDRSRFLRGQVDAYSWVEMGSSYLPNELSAGYLYAQLEIADEINEDRLNSWRLYYERLLPLAEQGRIVLPFVPAGCRHNAHLFYIKTKDMEERTALIAHLKSRGVIALFHYIPLHSSKAGQKYGRFSGEEIYTTKESERLLRLPMYYGLGEENIDRVVAAIYEFYQKGIR